MSLFRRRYYAPLSQTCTAGACARSCKSRRAPRPRKPDGKLSRHGLGARRVALLAPRGVLSKYRYPLSYVGAMTKIFGKVQKLVPHFGRRQAYSEWGRSAEGEEGVSYSHVRGRQLVYSPITTHTPSECCMNSRVTPKPMGTGQKCSMAGGICPPLNICAPKPRRNVFGGYPCFTPSPLVSIRSCFGYINAQFDRACLNTMKTLLKKSNENSERVLFEHDVSARRTARSNNLCVFDHGGLSFKTAR